MKKTQTKTQTKKNKNKNIRGSCKNRVNKKTIRKGGMLSALRGLLGRSSASSAVRGPVLPPSAVRGAVLPPGDGMEVVLPPPASSAVRGAVIPRGDGMEVVLPPAAGMEVVLPPVAPSDGDKRKRQEEEEPAPDHDDKRKHQEEEEPAPDHGDKRKRQEEEEPAPDHDDKRQREEEICWVCHETFSEDNIRNFGPKIGCIGTKPHFCHKTCIEQECERQRKLRLPYDKLCRCACQALINLPENILKALKFKRLKNDDPKGELLKIAQEIIDNIGDKDAALKIYEDLAAHGIDFAIDFFKKKVKNGDEVALKILENLAVDNGEIFAINYFKKRARSLDINALRVIGEAAEKWKVAEDFLYFSKSRKLYPGEEELIEPDGSLKFILLSPRSENDAEMQRDTRRWPKNYKPTEDELIQWDIKMPQYWWTLNDGANLPIGWALSRQKRIFFEFKGKYYPFERYKRKDGARRPEWMLPNPPSDWDDSD